MPKPRNVRAAPEGADFDSRLLGAMRSASLLLQAVASHERELSELAKLGQSPAHSAKAVVDLCSDSVLFGCDDGAVRPAESRRALDRSASETTTLRATPSRGALTLHGSNELHPLWQGDVDDGLCASFTSTSTMSHTGTGSMLGFVPSEGHLGDLVGEDACCARCVWQPSSKHRIAWEVLSVVVIGWDLFTLPLATFGFDTLPGIDTVGACTTAFWVVDMVFSFFVGFQRPDGLIEMRLPAIARHYMRSWFFFDFSVVMVDILFLIIFGGGLSVDGVRLGKTIRVVRLMRSFRLVRLARLMKFAYLLERVADAIVSRALLTILNILKLLGGVALVTHFIACGWHAVGTWHGRKEGWVRDFPGMSKAFLYVTAFHWSMAQFTPAPNNVHPTNLEERIFALLALFIGLVLFTSLIGRVTTLLAQSRRQAYEQLVETEMLRELCTRQRVSIALGTRIMRFLQNQAWGADKRVVEDDVASLKKLPASMLVDLRYEMFARPLAVSPLFHLMKVSQRPLMSEVCYMAVKETRIPRGDELFHLGARGTHVYLISHGEFVYLPRLASSRPADLGQGLQLAPSDWLSEAVLWTSWSHRGLLTAKGSGSVLTVHGEHFRLAAQRFVPCVHLLRRYAREFAQLMRDADLDRWSVDDLWKPFSDADDIIVKLSATSPGAYASSERHRDADEPRSAISCVVNASVQQRREQCSEERV